MAHDDHDLSAQEIPFFARYSERQIIQDISEEELKKISGGVSPLVTFKYPSDIDEIAKPKKV